MTCREVIERHLLESVDSRRHLFEAHLAGCVECLAYVRGYADTVRLARAAYAEPPETRA